MLKSSTFLFLSAATTSLALSSYWGKLTGRPFRFAGTVEATYVHVPSRVSSTVATIWVREGDVVKKAQPLVELDCEDVRVDAAIAEREFKRHERLYKAGSLPFETYDRSQSRRDLTALNSQWCQIMSPINGVVLARTREPGEWVSPGSGLLTLADFDELFVYIYVPQEDLHRLRQGDQVTVRIPEAGDRPRRGTIAFIRPEAEFTPKNVQTREERTRLVFGVKILLENADRVMKPGMPVEVDVPR